VLWLSLEASEPFKEKDSRMSEAEKPLGEQMTDAMESIRKQLDLLRSGPTIGGPSDDRSVIADLEAEFQSLKEARGNLGFADR